MHRLIEILIAPLQPKQIDPGMYNLISGIKNGSRKQKIEGMKQ